MKKTLIYILAAAAVLGACSRESMDATKGVPSDHTGITLTPVCALPGTKADGTTPGDPTYNENIIEDYFWFVYGDEAGNDLRICGYETGSRSKNINLDEAFPTGGTGYAYVVSNLPADKFTFAPAEGESKGGIRYEGTVYSTLSEIQSLPIDLTFYAATSATTGTVAPGNFVMRTSAPVPFTLSERTNVHVTASLARVSIKLVFDIKVAQEINQMETSVSGSEKYKKTWISDVEHLQIYMLWGSSHSTISGTPIEYDDATKDYFYSASPRYAMYGYDAQNGKYVDSGYPYALGGYWNGSSVDGNVVGAKANGQTLQIPTSVWKIAYKVKQDENNEPIWIWNASTAEADRTDDNIGNMSYGDWDYELDANGQKQELLDEDGNVMRYLAKENVERNYWILSSTPLYTTPITWNVNAVHAPFIKIILPWQGVERADSGTGDIIKTDSKPTEYYYKILIPNRTTLEANNYYRIRLDLSVLGSEADDVPIVVSGEYFVVDWNAEAAPVGGEFQVGRYLNCESNFAFYSQNSMPISVNSSHEIEVAASSATYQDYSGATETTADLPAGTYTITPSGNNLVTITHTMETDLDKMNNYDVSPITYTITLRHKGDGGDAYSKTITVVQYPSLYVKAELNSNYLLGTNRTARDRYLGYVYVNNGQDNDSDNWYYTGGLYGSSGNQNPNMYVITTTVFDSSLNYVLGDPRVDVVNNLNYNFASAPSIEGGNRRLSYYYPTDSDNSKRHFVSPSYRIVSSYGRFGSAKSLELAQRRCAAYQEDGYPAGRWRLPTEAELEYITTLSAKGRIPPLFNTGGTYWSAQSAVTVNSNGTVSISSARSAFARCVYDEWYWGSETVTKTTFTWGDEER